MSTRTLESGFEIFGRYIILKKVESDDQEETYAAIDMDTDKVVFLKVGEFSNESFKLSCMNKYFHVPNSIAPVLNSFLYKGKTVFVFDSIYTNLRKILSGVKVQDFQIIQSAAKLIVKALCEVNEYDIIYGDLRPETVAIEPATNSIKLIDFGRSFNRNMDRNSCFRTSSYSSLEVILHNTPFTPAIDMWSLGCILLEMFTGKIVFEADDELAQLRQMTSVLGPIPESLIAGDRTFVFYDLKPPVFPLISLITNISSLFKKAPPQPTLDVILQDCSDHDFIDFVKRCLVFDPSLRMTPLEALKSNWFEPKEPEPVKVISLKAKKKAALLRVFQWIKYPFVLAYRLGFNFFYSLNVFLDIKPTFVLREKINVNAACFTDSDSSIEEE